MDEIDVPPFFLCPISLDIMKDPVIVPTGITYDRQSIEKWLFSGKTNTCPITKQILSDPDLTPNHTLRRLIQSWCTLNAPYGIERFPTPKPPISKTQIEKILRDAKCPNMQLKCLKRLKSIASESDANKRLIEASGAGDFLASIIITATTMEEVLEKESRQEKSHLATEFDFRSAYDEALSILFHLQLSESGLKSLIHKNGQLIESLSRVMQSATYDSRTYSVLLLNSMLEVADPMHLVSLNCDLFNELAKLLGNQISNRASKAALQVLVNACPWGRNRIKAVEAGMVSLLIDLLLENSDKRTCELVLMVLDILCQCAEGREKLLIHGAGLAVVSKKIMRVSQVASERGVRIISSISRFSASPSVLVEMLQLGVVAKLGLVLQVDCGSRTKEKVREILKLHAKAWKNSPCTPMNLKLSYPF